jgi:2-methylcitrate dehydratase PrpD
MTGMLELRERGIDTDSIDRIELHLPELHAGILPFTQPRNPGEALFSLPYCAAIALLTGNLTITDIAEQSWQRDDVKHLVARTSLRAFEAERPELNFDPQQPDRIVIDCANESHSVDIPYPLGSPQYPLSNDQLMQKFQLNAGLDDAAVKRAWERLGNWQQAANLHDLFTPQAPG